MGGFVNGLATGMIDKLALTVLTTETLLAIVDVSIFDTLR